MAEAKQRQLLKTKVLNALAAGADTTGKIRRATGLTSRDVSAALCGLRTLGVVEVAASASVPTGARPGHVWKLKGKQ